MMFKFPPYSSRLISVGMISLMFSGMAHADYATLSNTNWEVTLTDAGYSDYLGDHTPGYVGREYLSGEWGAAVGYSKGGETVMPIWLEPNFIYPDWTTNSDFTTVDTIHETATDANGYTSEAASVIANTDLQIAQSFKVVDTLTGIPMGLDAASAGGLGHSLLSNRYALLQSYSITNTTAETLSNLQFFQFLHSLNGQAGVYDNRSYAGAYSDYRYDITLSGVDSGSIGGQVDYIGFSSTIAPTAFEIGHYGVENNGIDNHSLGKPSVGTHLSVEANNLNNNDSFAPTDRWVGGAERWDLNSLAPGETKTLSVMLTILTGWQVDAGTSTGIGNGDGSNGSIGSVGYEFEGDHSAGQFFISYHQEDANTVKELIAEGDIGTPNFSIPGDKLQLFEVDFDGDFTGLLKLTFGFDSTLLGDGFDESLLRVFHWKHNQWENLGGVVDYANSTITVYTDSLSPFAVAAVPVPGAVWLFASGLLGLRLLRKRSAS